VTMQGLSRVVVGFFLGSVLALPQEAAAQNVPGQTVKVGVMLPATGPGAALATQMRAAYELALAHIGGKLGGRDTQLIYVDTQAKPEIARELADELIKSQKVQFITGALFSNLVMALHGPVTQAEVFFIEPIGGPAPLAGARCSNFFFNLSAQNDQVAEAMGMHLAEKKIKKLYTITANYQAGKDMISGMKRFYTGGIAGEVYTRFGQLDFAAELSSLRDAAPDAVFTFYPGEMAVQFVKQYSLLGLLNKIPLYAVWTVDQLSLPAIGDAAIGVEGTGVWSVDLPNPVNQKFVADFKAKTGVLPNDYAATSYDSLILIDSALKAVSNIEDKAKLTKALHAADFKSVRGDFKFGVNNFPIQDYKLRKVVKNEKGELITQTIALLASGAVDSYAKDCKLKH
jgi:branched-chain amino acid transport system substrate-binding protein